MTHIRDLIKTKFIKTEIQIIIIFCFNSEFVLLTSHPMVLSYIAFLVSSIYGFSQFSVFVHLVFQIFFAVHSFYSSIIVSKIIDKNSKIIVI